MESKRTYQEKVCELIKNQTKLLKRSIFIGITVIMIFALSGCHEEMISVETKPTSHSALIKKATPLIMAKAQLESKVTLDKEFNAGTSRNSYKDIRMPIPKDTITTLYERTSTRKVELNKTTWKETYDGIGVPLFRITF